MRSELLVRETRTSSAKDDHHLVIADRMSTLDICDSIMVIQHGVIKAFDTPGSCTKTATSTARRFRSPASAADAVEFTAPEVIAVASSVGRDSEGRRDFLWHAPRLHAVGDAAAPAHPADAVAGGVA